MVSKETPSPAVKNMQKEEMTDMTREEVEAKLQEIEAELKEIGITVPQTPVNFTTPEQIRSHPQTQEPVDEKEEFTGGAKPKAKKKKNRNKTKSTIQPLVFKVPERRD